MKKFSLLRLGNAHVNREVPRWGQLVWSGTSEQLYINSSLGCQLDSRKPGFAPGLVTQQLIYLPLFCREI